MSDGFAAIFWGIVTFSILIVIHEGGHFAAARMFGVKVHEFMIGLPGPALRFRGKKTTYGITAIPLGGYVRIAGMEPGPEEPELAPVLASVTKLGTANAAQVSLDTGIDENDADRALLTLADWDALEQVEGDEYSYRSRFAADDAADETALLTRARAVTYRGLSTPKRVLVLAAGVLMNLLTAVLVFTIVLSTYTHSRPTLTIEQVAKSSAAEKAGVRPGDKIVTVAGKTVKNWDSVTRTIAEREIGDTIDLVVERNGSRVEFRPVLGAGEDGKTPMLGVISKLEEVRLSPPAALVESISYIGMTFTAIIAFFNPATFSSSVDNASSIIGISYVAAEVAQTSAIQYASLVALISLSLGMLNVMPIPPLDGGKIAMEIIERFAGRALPKKVSLAISTTGAVLLFTLIFYLMYADVMKFIVK